MAAGLRFELGGAGSASAGLRSPGVASAQPRTVTEAAFGPSTSASVPSRRQALAPNDPAGMTFWIGVGSLGLLLVVYHSLPE